MFEPNLDCIVDFTSSTTINNFTSFYSYKKCFKTKTRLCPQQMLVHNGGQIKNWGGECRDATHTKLQCQNIQRALQVFYHDYKFSKSKSATGDNPKKK